MHKGVVNGIFRTRVRGKNYYLLCTNTILRFFILRISLKALRMVLGIKSMVINVGNSLFIIFEK